MYYYRTRRLIFFYTFKYKEDRDRMKDLRFGDPDFRLDLASRYFRNALSLSISIWSFASNCARCEIVACRFATIRRRETGAMLLSLSAIYFLRRSMRVWIERAYRARSAELVN